MHGLAVSKALEHRVGDPDAATTLRAAFLRRYVDSDYAQALVRTGDAGTSVLKRLIDSNLDADVIATAHDLLAMIGSVVERQYVVARFAGHGPSGVRWPTSSQADSLRR